MQSLPLNGKGVSMQTVCKLQVTIGTDYHVYHCSCAFSVNIEQDLQAVFVRSNCLRLLPFVFSLWVAADTATILTLCA